MRLSVDRKSMNSAFEILDNISRNFKIKNLKIKGDIAMIDLSKVELKNSSTPLPAGDYFAFIETAELKQTKDGKGEYIKTTWRIADGMHKNRAVVQNYNIKSHSQQAVDIGLQDLKKIFLANNKTSLVFKGPSDLQGMKANIRVKIKNQDIYGDVNVITDYKPYQNGKSPLSSPSSIPGF